MKARWQLAQSLEIKWWERYLDGRDPETYLNWKRSYWKNFLATCELQVPKDAYLLDAGCGPAGIFTIFPEHRGLAIDPLLDSYRAKFPEFTNYNFPHWQWQNISLEQFEASAKFDLIFCLNAINHVANLQTSLQNLIATLRPGGTLVLSIDVHNFALLKRIFRLLPGDVLHPQQNDLAEYKQLIAEQGLRLENCILMKQEFIFNYYTLIAKKPI